MTTLCVCRGNVTTSSCSASYLTTISVFLVLKEIKNVQMDLGSTASTLMRMMQPLSSQLWTGNPVNLWKHANSWQALSSLIWEEQFHWKCCTHTHLYSKQMKLWEPPKMYARFELTSPIISKSVHFLQWQFGWKDPDHVNVLGGRFMHNCTWCSLPKSDKPGGLLL